MELTILIVILSII